MASWLPRRHTARFSTSRTASKSITCLRIRAAIDVVAQINLDRMLYRPTSKVIFNARDGLYQQVGPAVDVADGIDSGVCRRRSGNRSRICCGRRSHRRRSSITEQSWGQMMAKRASPVGTAPFILKKHQTDQSNDRDPGDRVGDNKAVPELAAATDRAVPARSSPHLQRSSASPWKIFPRQTIRQLPLFRSSEALRSSANS